jgi:hypothetical protein
MHPIMLEAWLPVSVLLQTSQDPLRLEQIKQLSTIGFLTVGVIALWKRDVSKESAWMANYKIMIEALLNNKTALDKMTASLEEMERTVAKIETVRAAISRRN